MNKVVMYGYERISKKLAEKMYNTGKTIHLCGCKMCPTVYNISHHNHGDMYNKDITFQQLVSSWTFYNGIHETGYYPAFYRLENEK